MLRMTRALAIAGLLLAACGSSSTSADAPVSTADSPVGTPDAKPGTPDAKPGTPDAPPSQMCYPQCFIDTIQTLAAGCAPTGACTQHTDIQTFTTTICYANGVKFSTAVNLQTSAVVTTVKNGSTVCYTQTATAPTQTSASLVYRDSGGAQVLEVDVPNTSQSNIANVICGSGGGSPVQIDLNSQSCKAVQPDAGPGPDGGPSCTQDPACTP